MIACAKLHKDLPEDFAEFLHSEQSIIGSSRWSGSNVENYQYMVTPDELASRIETIKSIMANSLLICWNEFITVS